MNKKLLVIVSLILIAVGGFLVWQKSKPIEIKMASKSEETQVVVTKVEEDSEAQEIEKLIARKIGNEDSDIVIVYSQGGPTTEVETEVLEEFRDSNEKLEDALIVQPHQVQTRRPELFTADHISFEQAVEYDKETVSNIAEVVKYYKAKDKKVYVVGISFGAFVSADLINAEGTELADGYGIMVGRLDMDEVFWKGFSQGMGGNFDKGITPMLSEAESVEESNMYRLAAGIGHKRFTELLKDKDLSNVVYVYGLVDEAVGKLTEKEVKFLKDRNAVVIENEGGHSEASTYETAAMMKLLLEK
ncbi:MAG: hypothetical protein N4A40_14995 [Tissierellales bacterium]|jgi:hypothetical protein|nr:hypothetical protein [Tissierellales bacterium]